MSPQQDQNKLYQEGRLILALNAYQSGQIRSIRAAALLYNVPRVTLTDRADGRVGDLTYAPTATNSQQQKRRL